MKKLIIGVCLITFFLFILNSNTIKIIGFYQDLDILKTNTLFYEEDKKAAYYKIYIYDESDNLLDIKKGTAIYTVTTIAYDENDTPIEYSEAYYRGDRNKFSIRLVQQ